MNRNIEIKAQLKNRDTPLLIIGQTRVHIDDVENLGDFLELEVVLTPDQKIEEGEKIARELMANLGIEKADLVSEAYVDLIARQ